MRHAIQKNVCLRSLKWTAGMILAFLPGIVFCPVSAPLNEKKTDGDAEKTGNPKTDLSSSALDSAVKENSAPGGVGSVPEKKSENALASLKNAVGAQAYIHTAVGFVSVYPEQNTPSAVIQEIFVKEGETLQKGQLIARLSAYAEKDIALSIARDKLKIAQHDLEIGQNTLTSRTKQWDRTKKLTTSRVISDQEFEKIQKDYIESTIDCTKKRLDVSIAENNMHLAEVELMQSQVRAPMDGTVLILNGKVGEKVRENDGILLMADLKTIEIVAEVHENDISKIFFGQKAQISLPNQSLFFIGQVTYISGIVRSNRIRNEDPKGAQDLRIVEVRLKVSPADAKKIERFLGMHVDVRFLNDSKTDITPSGLPQFDAIRSL